MSAPRLGRKTVQALVDHVTDGILVFNVDRAGEQRVLVTEAQARERAANIVQGMLASYTIQPIETEETA